MFFEQIKYVRRIAFSHYIVDDETLGKTCCCQSSGSILADFVYVKERLNKKNYVYSLKNITCPNENIKRNKSKISFNGPDLDLDSDSGSGSDSGSDSDPDESAEDLEKRYAKICAKLEEEKTETEESKKMINTLMVPYLDEIKKALDKII